MGRITNSIFPVLLFCMLLVFPFVARAEQKTGEKQPMSGTGSFSYASQDKRDPFEQVYTLKTRKKDASLNQEKSGYELEELKLVGVIKTGAVTFAVMEDSQGKGLMFKKGDFLNGNLWLSDFLDDKVVFAYRLKGDVRKIPVDIPRK